ncbi:MAG: sensor histidine kinase [Phenylobacterium sp.]
MRSAADATALGMAFVLESKPDGTRRFVFAGPRCLGVNGVEAEAIMRDAEVFFDMILPEHREAFAAARAEAEAGLEPFDIEVAMRRADGVVRWHRIAALLRRQADGALFWDGLQVDVTDRRQMAAALREQRRRLEVAVDATGLGFWEWDVEAGALSWSDRNKALFGLDPAAEVTLERYLELVHPEDLPQVTAAYEAARSQPHGGDYSLEHRVVRPDGETVWIQSTGRVSTDDEGQPRLVVGTSLDITARKAAEERRSLVMGELAHRAKNGIAVMMAMVAQTARGQQTVEGFQDVLMARLKAMADSQDLVTASGGRPVGLADVIGKAVAPFDQDRFDVDAGLGEVTLRGDMAIGMGLLLHEMATNALKYGALSNRNGRVVIAPEDAGDGRAAFRWRENGGPKVAPSKGSGFGTRLLNQVLRPQGGDVRFDFDPHGFHARVEFPTVR